MEKQHSQKQERQRKFLLVLPILVVPFLTLMFWSLGGDTATEASAQSTKRPGINMSLPDANFSKEKLLDKMSYYDHADSDSARLKELMKTDPYYNEDMSFDEADTNFPADGMEDTLPGNYRITGMPDYYHDPNEIKVYRKLEKLDAALKEKTYEKKEEEFNDRPATVSIDGANIDRLEEMMHTMNQGNGADPEMAQLDGMLERILDIQHPERVREKLRQTSDLNKGRVLAVTHAHKPELISLLASVQTIKSPLDNVQQNGFFAFDNKFAPADLQNAIEAVIHETQTVVNGSTVKLRLLNDVFINGVLIPKDHFFYGVASLSGERLRIQITGVRYEKSLFPVALSVYDMDGLDGIYIPGAITRDVAKQSADRSIQNIGFSSIDPSWQAQAAGAGVEAAKTLFSKKVKLVKVTLRAGYKVLLYDEKQKQEND